VVSFGVVNPLQSLMEFEVNESQLSYWSTDGHLHGV
jgi:hypothetical protein